MVSGEAMTAGLQVFNQSGIELVNTNDPMLVVLNQYNNFNPSGFGSITLPYNGWPEPPTILIRPRAGAWTGYFRIDRSGANVVVTLANRIVPASPQPVDIIVACSIQASGYVPGINYGLEVFDESGRPIFWSGLKLARIQQIAQVPGPNLQVAGSTTSASITTTFPSMPWVIARDAVQSVAFSGGGSSIPSAVAFHFSINSNFTVISVRADDTTSNANNQYAGRFLRFPLCIIPGT